ncbi:PEGA domain-containing protein [Thermococcus profundus]|uniref:PEGA domain-containing protein n=1 Tax=Thermococcus profundus TaxID=49899 RepID=UPI001E44B3ED|nr:PEGA domain-containing protein [Thermococcus profundus]
MVDSIPVTITVSGCYVLGSDFVGVSGNAIEIQADNVTFYGSWRWVNGTGSGYGVYVSNVSNVTVRDLKISNFSSGVYVTSSHDNAIINSVINTNKSGNGIMINQSLNTIIRDNILTGGGVSVWSSYHSTVVNNIVNGKPLVYIEGASEEVIEGELGQLVIVNSTDIQIVGVTITGTNPGILLVDTDNTVITNSNLTNNYVGIELDFSDNNTISQDIFKGNNNAVYISASNNNTITDNTIRNNGYGIVLRYSSNNTVTGNIISKSSKYGIYLDLSNDNVIYLNYLNGSQNVYSDGSSVNRWYSEEQIEYAYHGKVFISYLGNYWSDYTGSDSNGDGIGESPYSINANNTDKYPLVSSPSEYEKPARLTITSDPTRAEIYINGTYRGVTPTTLVLAPGTYEVLLVKEDYRNYTTTVTLNPGEDRVISADLVLAVGYLKVDTNPTGAKVYINGSLIGTTPLQNYKLPTGRHQLKLVKEGYKEYVTTIEIGPGLTTIVMVRLTPEPAVLTINSDPSGAKVYINGSYEGVTPLDLTLQPGTYEVRLLKEDYEDYTSVVTLEPGEERTLNVSLTPRFGYLTVYSTPAGAEVYVDGSLVGRTPVVGYKLSTGRHGVRIVKEDYEEYFKNVTIEPGEITVVNVTLTPKPAVLAINSDPSGAKVYINGTYEGLTPLDLTLRPGTYEVKLVKKDYENYTSVVTLEPGEEKTLNVSLTPRFGYLTVYSTPSGAEVYVDGSLVGRTPVVEYRLSTGRHEVRIVKEDYEEYFVNVTIEPGETTVVNVTLTPKPAVLTINSDPSGAKAYINGTYEGVTPLNLTLRPGTYEVKLVKEDYEDYSITVTLEPGEERTLSVSLTPRFGYLTVYSTPSGAEVYVDGSLIGKTPIRDYKLLTGRHEVRIVKEDYEEYFMNVTIEPGEITVVNVTLTPKPALLAINSDPSGAKVYINGTYKGVTPLNLTLQPGTYEVKLVKKDYENYTFTVTLEPGEERTLSVSLTPRFGYLTVYSTPAGAGVYVDGSLVGRSPVVGYKLSTGRHEVRIVKEDYEEYFKNVTIEPGETTVVNVTLTPKPAVLAINSDPSGAKVYINGSYEGVTPLNLTLQPGTYEVKLVKEDYENYTSVVTLEPGEERTLNVSLTPRFGYLTVYSVPSDAEVYVDGSLIGRTPVVGYKLSTGRHEVRIVKEDYEEYFVNVTIEPGETTVVNVTLTPKPAVLVINSDPSGAKVYINGTYEGVTPLNLTLQPGTYEVKLVKKDYEDYTSVVTLEPGEEKTLNVSLTPRFGYLTVYSVPSDAEVYVDGSLIGKTPVVEYRLLTGRHEVRIMKENYEEYSKNVTIEPGETTVVNVTLTPKPAVLTINSDPSGAKAYINGTYEGLTPLNLTLQPGTYEVRLLKEDYEDYSITVTLEPGEERTLNVSLTPRFGYLTVYSTPSGAEVYVDGSLVDRTPIRDYKLLTGRHEVRIVKEDYEEYFKNVTIEPGETTVVNVTLTPKPAVLAINSDPSGAKVYINGTYEGVTPLNLTLQPGTYEVRLVKEDYENYTFTVTLEPGEERTLNVSLTPRFGYLTVYSIPSDAEVYVDGSLVGKTPVVECRLSTGRHEVRIVKEDYEEYFMNVTIEPGKSTVINATLTPKPATLTIISIPAGAEVYINGTYEGLTPLNLTLQPGTYEVKLVKDEYKDYRTVIIISADETVSLNPTLSPVETTTTTTTTTATSTTTTTTTTTTPSSSSSTSNTGSGGICGPAGLLVLALLPAILRRRK